MLSPPRRTLHTSILDRSKLTRHKTLRGPRVGLILFRKDLENAKDLEKRVNDAVFPACQGGPDNNVSSRFAKTQMSHSILRKTDDCRCCDSPSAGSADIPRVRQAGHCQCRTLASGLMEHGYKLQTGGTDNHLVLWDLRSRR
jgi:glycine hydroxymethyltransferase